MSAARQVEKAWKASPHPDLAEVYADLRPGDSARDRLKRVKKLAARAPEHPESAFAIARAALEAGEFEQAREALAPHTGDPSQRVCLLMAEIESSEHADHGKAREWAARALRAKRDPAWVADGFVSERWLPASPATGRLDAFVWAVPPAATGPMLEQPSPPLAIALPEPESAAAGRAEEAAARRIMPPERGPERAVDPVVAEPPLPDDPGPELAAREPRKRFRLMDWLAGPSA